MHSSLTTCRGRGLHNNVRHVLAKAPDDWSCGLWTPWSANAGKRCHSQVCECRPWTIEGRQASAISRSSRSDFLGYGLSLVWFVIALRHLGLARTKRFIFNRPLFWRDGSDSPSRRANGRPSTGLPSEPAAEQRSPCGPKCRRSVSARIGLVDPRLGSSAVVSTASAAFFSLLRSAFFNIVLSSPPSDPVQPNYAL
jgi:hypothetical protein